MVRDTLNYSGCAENAGCARMDIGGGTVIVRFFGR